MKKDPTNFFTEYEVKEDIIISIVMGFGFGLVIVLAITLTFLLWW